jgi:hypothetical protein
LVVEFLTRHPCTLCEAARPAVTKWAGRLGARLVVHDIDADPELADRFGERVPVVRTPEGRVIAEGHISETRLVVGLVVAGLRSLLARDLHTLV